MLPNFLVIGAAKAASTWLADCLREHPDVFVAEIKEVQFFSRHFEKGLEWYEKHFSDWSGEVAIGEATPGYLGSPHAPIKIKETLGNVKLIASLRHPVDRAYSAFWHFSSRGRIPLGADFRTYFEQWHRKTGYYHAHLSRYFDLFPRENLLVLIFEDDIVSHPQEAIAGCYRFLGVDPGFNSETANRSSNKARAISVFHNQGWALRRAMYALPRGIQRRLAALGRFAYELAPKKQQGYTPLSQDLRQELLEEFFVSDIEQLEELLGRDLSVWYDQS